MTKEPQAMTELSPTPLTDERLAELSAALFGYCVGGCGCMTKTPEASQHLPTCLYRVCWESAVFIAQARHTLAVAEARNAALVRALERFGECKPSCTSWEPAFRKGDALINSGPCSCGYVAALTEQRGGKHE